MSIDLELQIASKVKTLPHPAQFREWVSAAIGDEINTGELTIRVVDEEEMSKLNLQFRNKKGPTNVLSFPYEPHPAVASRLLGDIVICAPVIEKEAKKHNKELLAHWAHMIVHGILHLMGYNHEEDDDAHEMENLETDILVNLGYEPPYGEENEQ